ncbi:hypothetical protein M5K25_001903 [Dendrobium thyrsiflorum]|uniref:Uncharacterized protein n=1 Tax=Dendrobium thyrsiflorum TaxID=117978 RepID=A0ABD0W4P6_DENTH
MPLGNIRALAITVILWCHLAAKPLGLEGPESSSSDQQMRDEGIKTTVIGTMSVIESREYKGEASVKAVIASKTTEALVDKDMLCQSSTCLLVPKTPDNIWLNSRPLLHRNCHKWYAELPKDSVKTFKELYITFIERFASATKKVIISYLDFEKTKKI